MSQSESDESEESTDSPERTREFDVEGAMVVDRVFEEEREEEREELTEGEKRKRRIMQRRLNRKVNVTDDLGETDDSEDGVATTFEFTVLDGEELDWLEDEPMSLVGTDEEEMGSEEAERYSRMKRQMARMLAEHSTEEAFDRQFWTQAYGPEERAQILGRIRREQNTVDAEGNR